MTRRLDLLDRPIFVIGAQRSGTTLLRLMLDAHPDVAIGPETAFARGVDAVVESPFFGHGEQWYRDYGWSREQLEREAAALYGQVFSSWARSMGAVRWGEKTPVHRYHIPRLAQWFPDAQFVGVVRHPGAVASSRERWGYEWEASLRDWAASSRHLVDAAEALPDDQVMLLRYEDLVGDPEGAMAACWGSSASVVGPRRGAPPGAPRAEVNEDRTLGGTDTSAGIDPTKAHRWADKADDRQRELLADREEQLAAWGYRVDDPFHVPAHAAGHVELLTRTTAPQARVDSTSMSSTDLDPRQAAAELEASRRAREALIARSTTSGPPAATRAPSRSSSDCGHSSPRPRSGCRPFGATSSASATGAASAPPCGWPGSSVADPDDLAGAQLIVRNRSR